ncbi:MAG: transketolase C-terminal domain-containing protein [Nitrospirota bacterium]|nr:transketolase C-terminal domain-containing protein [Nitrospirota bacterium]
MNYEELLKEIVLSDERFVVMTAENRSAIRNIPECLGERFIDVGIAEQSMIGIAAGLALRGRIPVVHALSAFLTMRAFEFIRTDIGIAGLPIKLVGAFPGFLSEANGPTHQAIEDIALMRGIPSMNVFCPSDEEDMLIGLETILKSPRPSYIRFNDLESSVKHDNVFHTGRAEILSEGEDITILTYGTLFREANRAMRLLEAEGKSVGLINLRTLKPIDEETIINAAMQTSLLVTVEDHFLAGGLFSILGEMFLRHNVTCRVLPFGLDERWFRPAMLQDILECEGLTGEKIADKILKESEKYAEYIKV